MITIVEFVGLPGSGKSTLMRAVKPTLIGSGLQLCESQPLVYRGRRRPIRVLMQIALHWRYSGLASTLYLLSLSAFRYGLAGVAAARLVPALLVDTERRRFAHAQSSPGDLILFDQGVLQQLRSIVAHAGPRPPRRHPGGMDTELGRALRKLRDTPSPSVNWMVVALEVPPDVASDRIQARAQNSGRFDRMEADRRFSLDPPMR
jgi:hypothetical protein